MNLDNVKTALEMFAEYKGKFKSEPKYYAEGDFLTYFLTEEDCIARQYGKLTLYIGVDTKQIVGYKLSGVKHHLQVLADQIHP